MKRDHSKGLDDMSDLQREAANIEPGLTCNTCKKKCKDMAEIRIHRKAEHPNYRPCRNYPGTSAEDRCKFGDKCDWPHLHLSEDSHICWSCGNIYPSKSDLAIHKEKHTQKHRPMQILEDYPANGGTNGLSDSLARRACLQQSSEDRKLH